MKKIALIVCTIFALAFFVFDTHITVNAYSGSASDEHKREDAENYIGETVDELLDGLDLDGIDELFSDFSFFQGEGGAKERIKGLITGEYSIDSSEILKELLNAFIGGLKGMAVPFAIIIAVAILTSVVEAVKPSFMDKSLSDLTYFVCFLVVVGVVSVLFNNVFSSVRKTTESLEKQSEVVFPIILTLMSASGGSVSASVYEPQVAFLAKSMSYVVKTVLMPIILMLFVFSAVGSMSDRIKLDKTNAFLKSLFKWISGLTAVIFNFFVTAQGITASVYDGASIKALKYALGNSIPLVGNLVSGGFDVVMASMILIKNAVGSFALIAVLFQVLSPILGIAVLNLFLRLTSAVCEPIESHKLSGFLSAVADATKYLTATAVLSASGYFITLLLTICSLGGAL